MVEPPEAARSPSNRLIHCCLLFKLSPQKSALTELL
jgi:hypothetical protein